jgi:hypothetical protein
MTILGDLLKGSVAVLAKLSEEALVISPTVTRYGTVSRERIEHEINNQGNTIAVRYIDVFIPIQNGTMSIKDEFTARGELWKVENIVVHELGTELTARQRRKNG